MQQRYPTEVQIAGRDFIRVSLRQAECELKVDIVNDSAEHVGDCVTVPRLGRVDSIANILSNKLTALYRYEGKDIADILEICRHETFVWSEALVHARNKESGIDAAAIAEIIATVPENELHGLAWTIEPDYEQLKRDAMLVSREILAGQDNSLCRPNKRQ